MADQFDMFDGEGAFLAKIRHLWNKAIEGEGGFCPCCGKWGKVYKTKMSQHLALCLRWISTHGDAEGWVDVQNTAPRFMLKSKTYTLLEHWDLIEPKSYRSGIWRATLKGQDFISGQISLPSAVHIYDNRVWGFEAEEISFRGCFGKHFDFDEMMSSQFKWANIQEKKQ
jgi:hypothetical protein